MTTYYPHNRNYCSHCPCRSLNEQEAQLMNELDDFYDIVSVSKDRQRLERTIFRLERAHDFAEQLLSSDTSPIAQIVNR